MSKKYKGTYNWARDQAVIELKNCHPTEWRLLYILFKAKGVEQRRVWQLVKSEMIKAFHEEFHNNLKMYRGKY